MSRKSQNPRTESFAAVVSNPKTGAGMPDDHSGNFEISDHDFKGNRETYSTVYNNDSLVQQAIHVPVVDCLTSWREISDPALSLHDSELNFKQVMLEAGAKSRLYGRALIVPVLVDSNGYKMALNRPLENLPKGIEIKKLIVVDDFEDGEELEKNVLSDNHGKPKHYIINDKKIHASRVIVVDGSVSGRSFLDGILIYFNGFHRAYAEAIRATEEANIPVLATNLQELAGQIQARKAMGISDVDYGEVLEARARNFRGNNNSRNAHLIDKNHEEVSNISKINIGDIVKVVEMSADLLCSAVDIPASRFLGKSYGGLNSSNTSDIQNYIQILHEMRTLLLEKPVRAFDRFVSDVTGSVTGFGYEWNVLAIERFLDKGSNNASSVD
ncbi:MAG: DUF1073 domain-containing protein [Gammaproteobacteria bacterium]|nr:DUF1073 domain-containing protein [Gammaproteobacteria bacterium]